MVQNRASVGISVVLLPLSHAQFSTCKIKGSLLVLNFGLSSKEDPKWAANWLLSPNAAV